MVPARAAAQETASQSHCEMALRMRNSDVSPPTDWIYNQQRRSLKNPAAIRDRAGLRQISAAVRSEFSSLERARRH